jgi:SAM-dependent methyltransferase
MSRDLLDRVVCSRCRETLDLRTGPVECSHCQASYPRVGRIPVLLSRPHDHVELWRHQLGLILAQGQETRRGLETQANEPALREEGKKRLRSLARAIADQVDDIAAVLGPVLGGPLTPTKDTGLPRGVVEYIYYLYRDWAWPEGEARENQRALDAIRAVATSALGRTLVLGAGGCRLAYDLHRSCGGIETAAVDIDPYLLVFAEAVVRGGEVRLTESTVNVQEAEHVAEAWTLRAAHGPFDEKTFHFFLANGVEPPFADGSFDTIVTPWFIDQVPLDLESFLSTLHRLLVPGGRWINQGPLIYRPDATPLAKRFSREEVFDLAGAAGFRIGKWSAESRPYLVSPLTGRGKVEWVLTFEAIRCASP